MSDIEPNETKPKKMVRRSVAITLGIVCILLVAGLGGAMVYYTVTINNKDNEVNSQKATIDQLNTNVTNLQKQLNDLLNAKKDSILYYDLYYDEFGNVSFRNPNYNFSPPVSMYPALWIALESGGWNASSLSDQTVFASLQYADFSRSGWEMLHEVMQPVEDYSSVQVNDTTYRYVWDISWGFGTRRSVLRYCFIDAATAETVERGAFAP